MTNELLGNAITISGSRGITREIANTSLNKHLSSLLGQKRVWWTGGAIGMDQRATEWLLEHNEECWIVVPFYAADQPQCTQSLFPRVAKVIELKLPKSNSAYIVRNQYMVKRSGAVFAFLANQSKGTLSTINYAISASREVHVFPTFLF